jgi:O-antigen/teichoic acid export membrane protein
MSTDAQRPALLSGAERRSILRDALAVVSSSHLATVCGVLQNLIILSIVPPRLTGIWTTVRTILDYGNHSSLGVNRAAGVEIAVAAGRHDRLAKGRISNVAMTVEVCAAVFVSLGLFSLALWCWKQGDVYWAASLLAGSLVATMSRYYAFNLTVLRSHKRFPTLARARAVGAFSELALFVAGAYYFNFYGMIGAAVIAQLLNACFIWFHGGLRFTPTLDRPMLGRLLATGWPLAAEALALIALRSVDRFVIVRCLANGEEQLGWYKIAIVMGAWTFDQSNLVAGVLFPRMGETLGRTSDPEYVLRLGLRAAEAIALGMVVCIGALLALGVPIVHAQLPAYRPGLGAAAGMVTAAALLGISMPLRYALLTIGRTRSMLVATGVAAAISLAGGLIMLQGSDDQVGTQLGQVAWNSAGAAGVLLVATLGVCVMARRELVPVGWRIVGAAAYLLFGAVALEFLRPHQVATLVTATLWSVLPLWKLGQIADWQSMLAWRSNSDADKC